MSNEKKDLLGSLIVFCRYKTNEILKNMSFLQSVEKFDTWIQLMEYYGASTYTGKNSYNNNKK